MDRIESLEEEFTNRGVKIIWERPGRNHGVYAKSVAGDRYIILDPSRPTAQTVVTLAHEAGHDACGLDDTPDRNEAAANRWAVRRLVHPKDIIQATIDGCRSYYELAEYLNLDYEFVKFSTEMLVQMHGPLIELGKYKLHLLPIWVIDKETGQVWPDD